MPPKNGSPKSSQPEQAESKARQTTISGFCQPPAGPSVIEIDPVLKEFPTNGDFNTKLEFLNSTIKVQKTSVILQLIKTGVLVKTVKPHSPNQSKAWEHFFQIYFENQKLDVVVCKMNHILQYKSSTGTHSMTAHLKKCQGQQTLHSIAKTDRPIESQDMEMILKSQVKFTSETLSSFSINNNPGLFQLCETMMKIGAKYGLKDAQELLYGRKTIAAHTYNEAKRFKKDLLEHLETNNVVRDNSFCLMADIWTSRYTKTSYLQVHVQFIDNNWTLKNTILSMEVFEESHTGKNIKERIHNEIHALACLPETTRIVTDCGSNMLVGVRDCDSTPCACHRMSTTIEHGWKNALMTDSTLSLMYEAVSKLITSLNHKANIQTKLKVKIRDSNQTRAWRGLYDKLFRINENVELLEAFAKTDKTLRPIYNIDKEYLENVLEFLCQFNDCFDDFEKESEPTIHMVAVNYYKLKDHINDYKKIESMISIAIAFEDALEEKFAPILLIEHFVACLLSPSYRKFKFFPAGPERERKLSEACVAVRDALSLMSDPKNLGPTPKKKAKTKKYGQDSSSEEDEVPDELNRYLKIKCESGTDTLSFWRTNQEKFPNLSKLAKSTLSKAAASSLSEKCFSVAGKIERPDRASIDPKNLAFCLIISFKNKFSFKYIITSNHHSIKSICYKQFNLEKIMKCYK